MLVSCPNGEVAERSKAHAWKACRRETASRVRIPVSPPLRHRTAHADCRRGFSVRSIHDGESISLGSDDECFMVTDLDLLGERAEVVTMATKAPLEVGRQPPQQPVGEIETDHCGKDQNEARAMHTVELGQPPYAIH